jgi:hypothetical protein
VKAVPGCAQGHYGLDWKGGQDVLAWLGLAGRAAEDAKERQRHKEATMMRLDRARRMLEANDGDEFRKNCGDLPLRLQ